MVDPTLVARTRAEAWHVGYGDNPWNWPDWRFAGDGGRFPGRFDDPDGLWRTKYAGETLLACFLEVLACFRPALDVYAELDEISEDPGSALHYPTVAAGYFPASGLRCDGSHEPNSPGRSWLSPRRPRSRICGQSLRPRLALAASRTLTPPPSRTQRRGR